MTIGIGVLCSTYPGWETKDPTVPRPDALIMIADTMLSHDSDSTVGFKIFTAPEVGLYAVGAGYLEVCAEIFPVFVDRFKNATIPRTHGFILAALNETVQGYRMEKFKLEVLNAKFAFIGDRISDAGKAAIHSEWQLYNQGTEMLVGAFADGGPAALYGINLRGGTQFVQTKVFPGHWQIGSGSYNASMWLNYRRQNLGMSIRQSALHAFEASCFAASSPSVNREPEMLIATRTERFLMHGDEVPKGCPISLRELRGLAARYGPRKTNALGFPKAQSNSASNSGNMH